VENCASSSLRRRHRRLFPEGTLVDSPFPFPPRGTSDDDFPCEASIQAAPALTGKGPTLPPNRPRRVREGELSEIVLGRVIIPGKA
jgi:hypothetical protein